MSQKTILSFFKQAETPTTNINSESCSANSKSKKSYAKDNSKNSKLNGDAKIASETEKSNSKKELRKSIINNNAESINNDHNGDSPVKQSKKRKRAKIIESDDDSNSSDELPKKTHDKPCDGTNENDEMDSSEVAPTSHMLDKPVAKSDQMSSNNRTTAQPAKRKKDAECVKSDKEDNTESSKKKKTKDNSSTVNYNDNIPANNDTNEKNSLATPSTNHSALTDDEKSSVDFIPKRKTARKQMRGGKQKIGKVSENLNKSPVKKENGVSTSNDENKLESDEEIKNKNSEKSDEEVDISKVKKESDSDEKPGDSKPNQVNKESSKKESDVNTNPKKNQVVHPFFASQKKENTSPKKENTSPKKENSSPKKENTTPKKESPDKEVKSSSSTGTVYDPTKGRYHPVDDACWKRNEKVPYLALAKTLELIENTSARLKIVEILSNFLRSVIVLTPEDLLYSVYLCLNRLAPEYEGIELGIGDMLLMRAVAQATGRTVDKIKAEVAVKGDLGLVAESSRGNQRVMFAPPKLTVSSVFSKFKEIAKMSGNTVQSKKTDKIQVLFVACRECEAKYIIRSLSGKMRIGLAEQSVLAALARAAVLTPPNQSYPPEIMDKSSGMSADKFKEHLIAQTLILKTTYCECPNFDLLIPVLLREGIAGLPEHCQLSPGCPLKPMLAHPTNGIDEVLNRFDRNEFTCEYKYDGERAQIHRTDKGEVKIFSRNQEDNTSKYPDVISRLTKALNDSTKSFILDTEAVAWDCETKQILPFQVLSTRKKKDAVESDIVVQVCIMAFDLLYLNGESLVKNTLKERRELLHSAFTEVTNEFMFVNYRDGDSAETMQEFLDESVKGNCEGLMVKALTVDASYEIAKRSHNWLKLKKDYLKGVGDTLDLVVIGGYHGKGKRTGTYGGFLLACYDDDNEEFQSICKLGTGFSEVELDTHTKFLKQHILKEPRSYYRYDNALEPDDWFDAVQIWEIKCADLSISPVHKAAIGIVDPEKGISLRFPRFLRIREDKAKPEDATPSSMIANMYQSQEQVQNTKNKNARPEEDYY